MVHPQCRGYVHKLCFIQLATKPQFDLRTQLQIPSVLNNRAHSSRPLRTQLQIFLSLLTKPFAHTAAEVVHAHSWDLTFPYKTCLSFALIFLYIKKPNFFLFTKIPIYTSRYYKTMASNHGHPKTLNPGFKPRVYYKKGF